MELSKHQKLLIQLFKALEMEEEMIIPLMVVIQDKTEQVIDYILEITDKGEKLNKDKVAKDIIEIGTNN